jgi:hypothetical protein
MLHTQRLFETLFPSPQESIIRLVAVVTFGLIDDAVVCNDRCVHDMSGNTVVPTRHLKDSHFMRLRDES